MSITNQGQRLKETSVAQFEAAIGLKLPPEYRSFLLEYNGGIPVPSSFHLKERSGAYTEDSVGVLYGINEGNDGLLAVYKNFISQGLFSDYLIIGTIVGSLPICIKLSGADAGCIYLWNWDHDFELELIEESFSAFLSGLYEQPPIIISPVAGPLANNDVGAVRKHISEGWDVNDYPTQGHTPIEHAAFFNYTELAELLLQHGAHLGRSIDLAKRRENYDVLEVLLKYDLQK